MILLYPFFPYSLTSINLPVFLQKKEAIKFEPIASKRISVYVAKIILATNIILPCKIIKINIFKTFEKLWFWKYCCFILMKQF